MGGTTGVQQSRRVRDTLLELREGLTSDPHASRRRVAELCAEVTGSSIGLWYVFGLVDGEPYPVEWSLVGGSDVVVRRQLEERLAWPSGDPRLPDPRWNGRFLMLRSIMDPEALARTRVYARCWRPIGLHDQLRMMLYFRGRHVAWIGAGRTRGEPPFERRDQRVLRELVPQITDALVHADVAARAGDALEGCDLVLDGRGHVELASCYAKRMLEVPERRAAVARWARAADRGGTVPPVIAGQRVRWSRLLSATGVRYLLHLEPVEPVCLDPMFELSKTQRTVAELASRGATVAEVAEALSVAPSTVRTHLRAVYEVLDVSSRAELAQRIGPHRADEA